MATAFVSWPNAPLTQSLVLRALGTLKYPPVITSIPPKSFDKLLQWSTYDSIDHELSHGYHNAVLSSSYIIRKSLIRKHFLSRCILSYLTKHPDSVLKGGAPRTWDLDISFADELDELWGDELWDLGQELDDPTKWWILKPGMADRGMGIRLFNSKAALQAIFEEFENELVSSDTENDDTRVVTSQLRHFVIQEYVLHPLLFDPSQVPLNGEVPSQLHGHKFHLRAYCISHGALKVYLYSRVLALFSAMPYTTPTIVDDDAGSAVYLGPHLTNTSLQAHRGEMGVRLLDELVGCTILSGTLRNGNDQFTAKDRATILEQMSDILGETFKAVLQSPVHFQPLPNSFELYGIDFLVEHQTSVSNGTSLQVKLLEINSEPAIELTGPRLTWILEDLFVAIAKLCVEPFFENASSESGTWAVGDMQDSLIKCLEVDVIKR